MKKKISILFLFVLFFACDPMDGRLTIVNRSKDTIFITLSPKGIIEQYPIRFDKGDTLWDQTEYTPPGEEDRPLSFGRNSWERTINTKYKDSTLTIYIFNKKFLSTVEVDSLLKHQLYSKKYSYKVKELNALNWRIEYK